MDYFSYFKDIADRNPMVMDTLQLKPSCGIPTGGLVHLMQHSHIERLAGAGEGEYRKDPEKAYISCVRNIGMNLLDQYLAGNPLTMGDRGYEGDAARGATTGAREIICDGMLIDSPEAVVEHIERYRIPGIKEAICSFDEEKSADGIIRYEYEIQEKLGPDMVKTAEGLVCHPNLSYDQYGYENYFMAYALYPEIMEELFSIQADFALLHNGAVARAYAEGGMPPLIRTGEDYADSRGTLVDIKSLEKIWFPHFTRCIQPVLKAGIRIIWHCDGNLTEMVPRLIEAGISGFQGFQYEDGMDYEKICRMKTKENEGLTIWAGISVTRTLPFGSPSDVRNEMKWLADNGPKTGLCLTTSSSVTPGVPWENIETMIEGFKYYREHGRQ